MNNVQYLVSIIYYCFKPQKIAQLQPYLLTSSNAFQFVKTPLFIGGGRMLTND